MSEREMPAGKRKPRERRDTVVDFNPAGNTTGLPSVEGVIQTSGHLVDPEVDREVERAFARITREGENDEIVAEGGESDDQHRSQEANPQDDAYAEVKIEETND